MNNQSYNASTGYNPSSILGKFISTLVGLIIYQICKDAIIFPIRQRIYRLIWQMGKKKRLKRLQKESEVNYNGDYNCRW